MAGAPVVLVPRPLQATNVASGAVVLANAAAALLVDVVADNGDDNVCELPC